MDVGVMWLNNCVFFGRLVRCCLCFERKSEHGDATTTTATTAATRGCWLSSVSTKSSLLCHCHHRPVTHTTRLWMKGIKIEECHSHTKQVMKCEYKGVGGSKHFLNSHLLIAVSYGCHLISMLIYYRYIHKKYNRKCAYVHIHHEKCDIS